MIYRIVEETGNLTGQKRFYIQKQKKKWFSKKYYWKNVVVRNSQTRVTMQVEFNTKEDAQKWINYKIETVKNIYH